MQQKEQVKLVRRWLQEFVIELKLCPFARRELVNERIRFAVTTAESSDQLLAVLQEELQLLVSDPDIETTLLIHPRVLQDFDDYNQFLDLADALIEQEGYGGIFQVASFHPDYRFADTASDAAENYSNRSPLPLLHLLREASVARAVRSYPDIGNVPQRNIALLRRLGVGRLRAILNRDD